MYQNYDHAVDKVKKYLIENQFSASVIYSHLHCYRSFRQYLEENRFPYSHEKAIKWLNSNRPGWQHSKFKMFRLSLFQIDDIIRNGCITTCSYVYENSCNYDRLPEWSRLLLDDYLNNISSSFSDGYVKQHRMACSEFLIYISNIDGKNLKDINHKNVIKYSNQSEHRTIRTKNQYSRNIRYFLHYLAEKDLIPTSLAFALNRFSIPMIIIIDELPDAQQKAWIKCSGQITNEIPAIEYYSIARELGNTYLDRHKYSKTIKSVFRKAWRDLYIFLEANGFSYSYRIAEHLSICLKNYTGQWRSYRRAIKLFEQYREFGDINPRIIYSCKEDSINTLPDWSRSLFLDFLLRKRKEGNSASTISMYRSSCLKFLKFLETKEITCCAMISPEIIKEFHVSDPHSTAEARNAYSIKIRRFLDYLADMGYVPVTLQLALTTECAQKTEIVETLTEEDIASVYRFRLNAEKPIELRNTAIILIGLRMGLRASDITGMKLADISWKERTISVQQQKTGRFVILPMPIDVGNSLYRYIMNGRPCVDCDNVFIAHRVPYGGLNRTCCSRALNKALNKKKHGFHITRKTFASRMLKSNTDTDTIADSLGHSGISTVLEYLATDGETMRQCALSLKGIEVNGGMLL